MERGSSAEIGSDGSVTVVTHEDILFHIRLLEEMGYDWLGHQVIPINEDIPALEEARDILLRARQGHNPPEP